MAPRILESIDDLIAVMGIPFSDEQIAAITAPAAPTVIVAGAGSGKTTVMAARVVWLVGRGVVDPDQVLGLTFTRKAVGELRQRIDQALDRLTSWSATAADADPTPDGAWAIGRPQVQTYDGFAAGLVSEFGAWLGLDAGVRLIGSAEQLMMADAVLRQLPNDPVHLADKSLSVLAHAIINLDAQMGSHLVTTEQIERWSAQAQAWLAAAPLNRQGHTYKAIGEATTVIQQRLELLAWTRLYRHERHHSSSVTFNDQMGSAVELTDRLPSIGETLRQRFPVVVVDEYQDTSAAQARLLSNLFGLGGEVSDFAITAVGDPMQAIYTWRGAAADNIHAFHQTFPAATRRRFQLSINRRSGPAVLQAANAVIGQLSSDSASGELRPAEQAADATVELMSFDQELEQATWIADHLWQGHEAGTLQTWHEAAILVRRHRDAPAIVDACRRRGVPVVQNQLKGLLQEEAVAQIRAMMTVVVDPMANPALIELLVGPRFRLSVADLAVLGRRAGQLAKEAATAAGSPDDTAILSTPPMVSLMAGVLDPGSGDFSDSAVLAFRRLREDLTTLRQFEGGLLAKVRRLVELIGLPVELHATESASIIQVEQFMFFVATFARDYPHATLATLVERLMVELEEAGGLEMAPVVSTDSVQVMTVHAAKGLEWDWVVLPALNEGAFPSTSLRDNPLKNPDELPTAVRSDATAVPQVASWDDAGLKDYADRLKIALVDSETRLAYVAVTRARRQLILTHFRHRLGQVRLNEPSRYLMAIAAALGQEVSGQRDTEASAAAIEAEPVPVTIDWPQADDPCWALASQAVAASLDQLITWNSDALPAEDTVTIRAWDARLAQLRSTKESPPIDVALPAPLSVSAAMAWRRDPKAFTKRLARPLPRPQLGSQVVGVRFHDWVDRYYQQPEVGLLASATTTADATDDQLEAYKRTFLASVFADARPTGVELPFSATWRGGAITGRLDAVFARDRNPDLIPEDRDWLIVDWKTGRRPPDDLQLSLYAFSWAQMQGVALDRVALAFFHLATGRIDWVAPVDLAKLEDDWARLPQPSASTRDCFANQ
ncbi:MAG: ATP-dependent helicase [Propionibacteriaceae bacterium]|jgi:DNA helicase-2/ATP-dependent DNA helicase PcrA|nr:ATP-dependent helicase [Propionibacteriaceae bacterium]